MTIEEFNEICDIYTNKELFLTDSNNNLIKENNKPILRHQII
jgi:hypothetical protein